MNKKLTLLWSMCTIIQWVAAPSAFSDCNFMQLPVNLRLWIHIEQTLGNDVQFEEAQKVLISSTKSPTDYAPESQIAFKVKSYWIPESKLTTFEGTGFADHQSDLEKMIGGIKHFRLFVHPDSKKFYAKLIAKAHEAESLCATPSSSPRTLLIWKEDGSIKPFFGKLSMDLVMGNSHRLIGVAETTSSIGMNNILALARPSFPEGFSYIPEIFSLIPKGKKKGGMIIRRVPEGVLDGSLHLAPLYSLYGISKDGTPPLLISILKLKKESMTHYLTEHLIRPFVRQWISLAVTEGFVPEAHGQNTLLVLDSNGALTGQFVYRDLDGFAPDLSYRKTLGLPLPEHLPFIESYKSEYQQTRSKKRSWLFHSFRWFDNVQNILGVYGLIWIEEGTLPKEPFRQETLSNALFHEFNEKWKELGHSVSCATTECVITEIEKEKDTWLQCYSKDSQDHEKHIFPNGVHSNPVSCNKRILTKMRATDK
jgi:hypothetical protein